jgi:hypothetical protein
MTQTVGNQGVPLSQRCALVLRQSLRVTHLTTTRRQRRHDRTPLRVRVTRPLCDLIQRAIATDADTRVRIDRADFYTRGFDGLKSHKHFVIIAAPNGRELSGTLRALTGFEHF